MFYSKPHERINSIESLISCGSEAMHTIANGIPENISTRQTEVLKIYKRLNAAMQHKISPIPVCEIPVEWK